MGAVRILHGLCPNCNKKLFFRDSEVRLECPGCSQCLAPNQLAELGVAEDVSPILLSLMFYRLFGFTV